MQLINQIHIINCRRLQGCPLEEAEREFRKRRKRGDDTIECRNEAENKQEMWEQYRKT